MTTIYPMGTLVIADDCDQPRPRNVAVVVGHLDGGAYRLRYVARRLAGFGVFTASRPTPVAAFGVTLVVDVEGRLLTATQGASEAAYRDGKPRRWQDHVEERATLAPWALKRWGGFSLGETATRASINS